MNSEDEDERTGVTRDFSDGSLAAPDDLFGLFRFASEDKLLVGAASGGGGPVESRAT